MKLTRSLIRSASFFRRRRRTTSNASFRRTSTFFTRKRGAAAENPEPSSPKVTCIGQVRVQSQKRVKQYRRRIGEASFRSAEQPQPPRDQRWVHLPSVSVFLRAFGQEFCCLFRCRCCCFARRERGREKKKIKYSDDNGCGTMVERWLVAVNAGEGERRREIEVVVGSGEAEEEEETTEMMSAEHSRRHVFDDIEVNGDRVLINGEREAMTVSICIPPKNALLLMRCRSDPLKMAAIANRISSDAGKYKNGGFDEEDDDETQTTSSDELFAAEDKIYVAEVLDKEKMHVEEEVSSDRLEITKEEKVEEIEEEFNQEEEEEKEERESDLLSEAQDCAEEESKPDLDISTAKIDEIQETTIIQDEKEDKLEAELPEDEETAAKKEATAAAAAAAAALPECLLLMMREPKLSMEVSKETWVCATDFIRLLPERPRRPANKAAAGGCDHDPVVRKRTTVEKSKPRVPAPPGKKSDVQPARSSCSLPAAAAVNERKRANGGAPCEPLALTRCKSEPMSTAAAKLMPEAGCWKDNVEPHRQASVGVGAAGVGF